MTDLRIGDRHGIAVEGLGRDAEPMVVRIRAGRLGKDPARQHLLVCLINLLVRLHGSVSCIVLEVDGVLRVVLPHRAADCDAFDALEELAAWANDGRIPVVRDDRQVDLTVDVSAIAAPGADLYAWGAGWKAWVGTAPANFERPAHNFNCLGPYFAAAMLAGEVFKSSKGLMSGRHAQDDAYSLWTGEVGPWGAVSDGPPIRSAGVPPIYLVGAGAVGQGVVQTLGALDLAEAYVVTIDHDSHDLEGTNLNRCFLAGVQDIDQPKVSAIARYRKLAAFDGYEFEGRLSDYLVAEKRGLHPDLAAAELEGIFRLVVSAVDVNPSRQDIQGLQPRMVVGGSTDGLRAQSTSYGVVEGSECLACWNVAKDGKERARAVEAELRQLPRAERRARLEGNVGDLAAALDYLAEPEPLCGHLGEADVRRFASRIAPEFSVSFVSMAAAAMTVARLLKATTLSHVGWEGAAKSLYHFRSLKSEETTQARRVDCPLCQAP